MISWTKEGQHSSMSDTAQNSSISFPAIASATTQPAASAGVPLLDLSRQNQPLREELWAALERVCDSGRFILGPDCTELEERLAKYCQAQDAVACASGSDALLLALMALNIGPGDEVLLPSYTFFATASAVTRLGARPVFVDIDPASFNICPAHLTSLVTPVSKAIIPVHLFGQCADMAAINAIAREHHLAVVEDAAQAIGAEFQGRRAGSLGDIGCISFYPTKNLGGFGDGGLLTTSRPELADSLRLLRAHGMQPRYYHRVIGINSRLDTLQAAVLNVKIPHLEAWTIQRQVNADRYSEMFTAAGLHNTVTLPTAGPDRRCAWNQYVVRVPDGRRDALRKHLADARIGTEIYYPLALHQQECFRYLGYGPGSLPESERAAAETLALPIFPELTAGEQQTVVRSIGQFFAATNATQPVHRYRDAA
jgi:dTDP-4-amino-4,6-dideoxygalactose transaminase